MFKIPDWDDDTQGNKVGNILKVPNVKKKLKISNLSPSTKQNGVTKPSFKTKNNKKKNKLNSKKNILLINNVKSKVNTQKSNKVVNDSQVPDNTIPMEVQTNHVQEQTSLNKKQKLNKKNRKKNALLNNNINGEKSSKVENNKEPVQTNQVQEQTSLNKKQKPNKINQKEKTLNNNHVISKVNIQKSSKVENDNQVPEKPVPMEVQTDQETSINKKQKLNKNPKKNKNNSNDKVSLKNYDTDKLDELILIEKKKKLNKAKNDNIEENILFNENSVENKVKSKIENKKEFLKKLLQKETNRNHINVKSNALRNRMLERLKAAKFRYLNEKLYTTSGSEAQKLFKEDPAAFQTYHEGYQQQMKKWPVKPLDVIIQRIQKMPKNYKIADMGCGEAELSRRVSQTVRSFDLIARAENIEECDIAHTPILAATIDVAVYCLALMGTNLTQYLLEANRILRIGGHLLIAEVESRFDKVDDFVKDVQKLGFSLKKLDKSHEVFFFMEFTKIREPPSKKGKIPYLTLKPCIYKKR